MQLHVFQLLCKGARKLNLCNTLVVKFTDEQYTTINQSRAGHFDLRVFVNCLQAATSINTSMSLYSITMHDTIACMWAYGSMSFT